MDDALVQLLREGTLGKVRFGMPKQDVLEMFADCAREDGWGRDVLCYPVREGEQFGARMVLSFEGGLLRGIELWFGGTHAESIELPEVCGASYGVINGRLNVNQFKELMDRSGIGYRLSKSNASTPKPVVVSQSGAEAVFEEFDDAQPRLAKILHTDVDGLRAEYRRRFATDLIGRWCYPDAQPYFNQEIEFRSDGTGTFCKWGSSDKEVELQWRRHGGRTIEIKTPDSDWECVRYDFGFCRGGPYDEPWLYLYEPGRCSEDKEPKFWRSAYLVRFEEGDA